MVKHIPIIMSTPMAIATEEGIKTITRRMKKLEPVNKNPNDWELIAMSTAPETGEIFAHLKGPSITSGALVPCPYGQIGDRLYVRENFRLVGWDFEDGEYTLEYADGAQHTFYEADINGDEMASWVAGKLNSLVKKEVLMQDPEDEERLVFSLKPNPWTPSIHLPKWGSRLWLCILDVKLERLHSITTEDIKAEGVTIPVNEKTGGILYALGEENSAASFLPAESLRPGVTPPTEDEIFRAHWAELWCKINGRESWDANPWVWVIKFKKVDAPTVENP